MNIRRFLLGGTVVWLGLACFAVPTTGLAQEKEAETTPPILIRPANFDPDDEWAYTRLRGNTLPGYRADGPVWNAPPLALQRQGVPSAPAAEGEQGENQPAAAAVGGSVIVPGPLMTYAEAYNAIEFRRSEYEANPGYRHDAAMELMFGAMRPTTIVKHNLPYFSRYPDNYLFPIGVHPGFPGLQFFSGLSSYGPAYWRGLLP